MKTVLISALIIYSVSITVLFFMMREMLNKYIQSNANEEPKTKYDWSKIPDDVNWVATNENGFAWGYEGKPVSGWLHSGFWYLGGDKGLVYWPYENPYKGEWRESLEKRPEERDQYEKHAKKAEEAISKGASLTNHRIEL
ncbi:hypothetical protein [Acinetobacter baumannii]|uniref:hypothetical protein n=1 Tax=Acinetobacter baumannii TaxID=470 RepID=UPI00044F0CFB|nr:hypothetical protein [Acinetobacter baumannii]EXE66026.1 hypothetical protein J585_3643 [Acinetobacter baumannii 397971]EXH57993.1 hypothetical protein J620_0891 [Acinetobacter baumannii 1533268]EYT35798.1 hypothetical protein J547_02991 [Acinetobacter baumannii 110912]UYP92776.1 hypothetical protein OIO45_04900 [Acinetobacter baumannii]UYP94590.1 hypothetical protein OIO53_14070 [Acinetobacter baumannii]